MNQKQAHLKTIRQLAWFMDAKFQLPGGWRIGWDGIIGFIPGIGDLITNVLGFYIIWVAARLGCPASVLTRMGLRLAIENLIDCIPILGNVFDIFMKSNLRNVRLVEAYLQNPTATRRSSRSVIGLILALIAVIMLLSVGLIFYIAVMALRLIQRF